MARTQRFGLTHFGAEADGSFGDDGGKFTGRDRQFLDRILAAYEVHDHSGGQRLADPDFEPTLDLSAVGGVLPSGTTLYYRVSFIDRHGLETAASAEVSVETPGAVGVPAPPAVEARAGGALDPGLYWYGVTVHSAGNETQMSPPQVIQITDWNTVAFSSFEPLPDGADEISVWRQGPFDAGFTRLVTMPVPVDLVDYFLDDGSIASDPCACDPENLPPDENFTNATNSVTIEIPAEAVAEGTGVQRWRIYRSESSGVYPASSLVAEVVETVTEEGYDLVNTFVDTGETLGVGQPVTVSQTLAGSSLVPITVVSALPDPATLPEGFPALFDGVLHAVLGGAWEVVGGGSGLDEDGALPLEDLADEPDPPAAGGKLYMHAGELRFLHADGTKTILAGGA